MGILSGLEKFGLGQFKDAKIAREENTKNSFSGTAATERPKLTEEDCLYDKHYKCPICDVNFTARSVRAGKLKMSSKDSDLRPVYEVMDPIKYDAIACDKCGYAALTRYFGKLTTTQIRSIREQIGGSFSGMESQGNIYSYQDALYRYKLALACAIVKNAKNSERGYICLKMSWLYRGFRLSEDVKDEELKKALEAEELECAGNAYELLTDALSNEAFPIAGMDENTLKYLLAELGRKLKKYDEAVKLISGVITSRAVADRLKDQALTLRDRIKEDMKSGN